MKSVKRLGLIVGLAAVIVSGSALGASAQGMYTCTLAAADCQILTTADSNVAKETSFNQDFEFSVKANTGTQNIDVEATGTGVFSIDPTASMTDPTTLYKGVKLSADITGSTKGTGNDQSGKLSLVIVNGIAYANANDGKGWNGVQLSDLIKGAQSMAAGMPSTPGAPSSANPAAALAQDPAFISSLMALPNIKGFITLAKTANTPTLDGQNMVEFTYAVSPTALISAPELSPLIKAIAKASGSSDVTDAQIQQIQPIASSLLAKTTLTVTRWVGATDNMYHALGIDLVANIDPTMLGGTAPVTANVHLLIKLTKVGQPVTVTAPAGAKMADMSSLSGGAAGTMSATMAATMAATPAQ